MEVAVLEQASWRFAQRKENDIDLPRLASISDWTDEVRRLLMSEGTFALALDHLLQRPTGFHLALARQSANSETTRRLRYARRLALSLHLGHHTGRKGGVAAVDLKTRGARRGTWPLPAWATVENCAVIVDNPEGNSHAPPARDLYQVFIDAGEDLATPTIAPAVAHRCATALAAYLQPRLRARAPTFIMLAMDFMFIGGREPVPIEIHVPARSIGPAGIAHSITYGSDPRRWLNAVDLSNIVPYPEPLLRNEPFHHLDLAFARQFVSSRSQLGLEAIQWPLEARLNGSFLAIGGLRFRASDLTRSVLQEIAAATATIRQPNYAVVSPGDRSKLLVAIDHAEWVVVKDNRNLPWWHPDTRPVRFIAGPSDPDLESVLRDLADHELLVEPLVRDSLDTRGRSGELRVFAYCLIEPEPMHK